MLISKLYWRVYANTGIATDSARVARANRVARGLASLCRRLFIAAPLPDLAVPADEPCAVPCEVRQAFSTRRVQSGRHSARGGGQSACRGVFDGPGLVIGGALKSAVVDSRRTASKAPRILKDPVG